MNMAALYSKLGTRSNLEKMGLGSLKTIQMRYVSNLKAPDTG